MLSQIYAVNKLSAISKILRSSEFIFEDILAKKIFINYVVCAHKIFYV